MSLTAAGIRFGIFLLALQGTVQIYLNEVEGRFEYEVFCVSLRDALQTFKRAVNIYSDLFTRFTANIQVSLIWIVCVHLR